MKNSFLCFTAYLLFTCLSVNAQDKSASYDLGSIETTLSKFHLLKSTYNFPIKDLQSEKFAFVVPSNLKEWENYILRYKQVSVFNLQDNDCQQQIEADFIEHLLIVVDSTSVCKDIKLLQRKYKTSLLVFKDSVDVLLKECFLDAENVFHCTEDNALSRDLAVQYFFNGISIEGRLFDKYKRLSYLSAEVLGLEGNTIKSSVDSVVNDAISAGAFPGCRVLVAHRGVVIFNEAYGYHTYNERIKVQQHDVYDLASVTKIGGPLPLIMKACSDGMMELDEPFYTYWPDWNNRLFHRSNKEEMTVREVLAHQARLTPYINYYPQLLKNGELNPNYFQIIESEQYQLKIDYHLFLSTAFKKKVYKAIRKSPLLDEAKYKYSGLSYMIYPQLLSDLYRIDYEQNLYNAFFEPLGASSLRYNPLDKLAHERIVPTEYDANFRNKQIKGFVHDEAAAVMGGVSGNAGLFGSAHDLAKLMQMYLQKGQYAGKQYISEEVFEEFTRVQFPENENRRGAGFDKPLFGNDTLSIEKSYPAPGVSAQSFGHSGFTGTFVWVDPEYELVYIFLSNRVYPTRENRLIYQMNVRPSIQQIFYDAIKQSKHYQSSGKS